MGALGGFKLPDFLHFCQRFKMPSLPRLRTSHEFIFCDITIRFVCISMHPRHTQHGFISGTDLNNALNFINEKLIYWCFDHFLMRLHDDNENGTHCVHVGIFRMLWCQSTTGFSRITKSAINEEKWPTMASLSSLGEMAAVWQWIWMH
jgi:hypothetical protein